MIPLQLYSDSRGNVPSGRCTPDHVEIFAWLRYLRKSALVLDGFEDSFQGKQRGHSFYTPPHLPRRSVQTTVQIPKTNHTDAQHTERSFFSRCHGTIYPCKNIIKRRQLLKKRRKARLLERSTVNTVIRLAPNQRPIVSSLGHHLCTTEIGRPKS